MTASRKTKSKAEISASEARLAEPSNSELMAGITAIERRLDTLFKNLPALARMTDNAEMRRDRKQFEECKKDSITKKVAKLSK